MVSTRQVGDKAEELACRFLITKGYKILERNFLIRGGEIDIVAEQGKNLVFVEVKARWSHEFGLPVESITRFKLKALKKTALFYIQMHRLWDRSYRFDLVGIDYASDRGNPQIELIENITG